MSRPCYGQFMGLSYLHMLHALSRLPFIAEEELARILGEDELLTHEALRDIFRAGIVGRVSHGAAHLDSSQRYYLTSRGIVEASRILGFRTPSEYVRAYPMSKEWLRLLIGRMDAVAAIYRLAATMSPGSSGLRTRVQFHRKGDFDATIILRDGRSFGVARQGRGLTRRSLRDRLRRIDEGKGGPRPDTILILTPSPWERNLTASWAEDEGFQDGYIAAESGGALTRRDLRVWRKISRLTDSFETLARVSSRGSPSEAPPWESPARKRASIPDPERMVRDAPSFGLSPSEKRMLDIITARPMIQRERLTRWLDVTEGRVSQMMHSLVSRWELVERYGSRRAFRYALSAGGISYITARDRAELRTTRGIWSADPADDPQGKREYVGHLIDTWRKQTEHSDGISWLLSRLAAEAGADPASALMWWVLDPWTERQFNWRASAITPDAVVELIAGGCRLAFLLEYERSARYPKRVRQRLARYERYHNSPDTEGDLIPMPFTLFVVDDEAAAETYVTTAADDMGLQLPVLVSSMPVLSNSGLLGRSWHRLWEPKSPRVKLSELGGYHWSRLYRRMALRRQG